MAGNRHKPGLEQGVYGVGVGRGDTVSFFASHVKGKENQNMNLTVIVQ